MKNKNNRLYLLSKKTLLKRVFFATFSAIVLLLAATVALNLAKSTTTLAEDRGTDVRILRGGNFTYGSGGDSGGGWSTFNYSVVAGGATYQAYCAQPDKAAPKQNYTYQSEPASYGYVEQCNQGACTLVSQPTEDDIKHRKMALLMYLYQTQNNSSHQSWIKYYYGEDGGDPKNKYGIIHATIGAIYTETRPEGPSYTGLNDAEITQVNKIITALKDAVTATENGNPGSGSVCEVGNADGCAEIAISAWRTIRESLTSANPINLYIARPYDGALQDIVYLNIPSGMGKILVQKCDSEVDTLAPDDSKDINNIFAADGDSSVDNSHNPNSNSNAVCKSRGRRSLAGIKFNVYHLMGVNEEDGKKVPIIDRDNPVGSMETNADGKAEIDLSPGIYYVEEVGTAENAAHANATYAKTAEGKATYISYAGNAPTLRFYDRPVRGDVRFVKKDADNNIKMQNTLFSISSIGIDNNIEETHIVVTDQNGVVDTSSSFARHSINTNGYDALYELDQPIVFSGYGTWFGLDGSGNQVPVDDTVGALPYGTYLIQELKCSRNMVCLNVKDSKKTVTIDKDNVTLNLGDWDNACAKLELGTTATDNHDGDKFIEANSKAEIKDKVRYCARVGLSYTIRGTLVERESGQPILENGQPITRSVALNNIAEPGCGEVEMVFSLDASNLGGKDVVVIEKLYYDNEVVIEHSDLNDENQTVTVISLHTYATDDYDGDKVIAADQDVRIKDLVTYCLKPNLEYTIKGVLMDKATGNALFVDGKTVESEITFTPTEACGEVTMYYDLNTKDLSGSELVIFESLYYNGNVIIEHKDINNTDETVQVEVKVPNTGAVSKENLQQNSSTNIILIASGAVVLSLGGYIFYRKSSKVKFSR